MTDPNLNEAVEQAINRVLGEEASAREAVEHCRVEAREAVNAARARASRILVRADARIGLLHRRCEQRVSGRLQELAVAARQIPEQAVVAPELQQRLQAVVRRLAKEMTSGGTE